MKKLPIVALIGQTNAGKSSLLNRFAHKNIAIVAREEGTTRDNVVARIDNRFLLIDTAGLKDPTDDFEAGIQDQIEDAIASADLILLTLDSSKYPDDKDKQIAKKALKSRKPVLLLLNKSDLGEALPEVEFLRLGIKPEQTFRLSATTGQGIRELKAAILEIIGASKGSLTSQSHEITEDGDLRSKNPSFISQSSEITDHHDSNNAVSIDELQESFEARKRTVLDIRRARTGETDAVDRDNDKLASQPLKLALIGRPNVGKSSLFNSLGQKQQALVSSRQGTTRDVNRVEVRYHGRTLEILDTAGLRKPGKREVGIEKFSALRTLAAIEESDICALLVDATEPHSKLDQSLAGQIIEAGKGIIVILTKADLVDDTDQILDQLEQDFNFLPYAPVLITSSATGQNVTKLFELATQIDQTRHLEIKTSDLNKILGEAIIEHPPAGLKNTRPKPKYIVQTDTCPPWFVVHGRDLGLLHWSWKRFLERKIREKYPFVGTPIMFSFRSDNTGRDSNSRKDTADNSQ